MRPHVRARAARARDAGAGSLARRVAFAALLACASAAALAEEPPAAEPPPYAGRAALSAEYSSGNSSTRRLYGDFDFTAQDKRRRWELSGKVDRRSTTAQDAADTGDTLAWRGNGNYDRFTAADRFAYLRGSVEHDSSKDLRRRQTAGFGYGAELRFAGETRVSVRGGLDYVSDHRYLDADQAYPALGWGLKITSKALGPRLELFHEEDGFFNLRERGTVVRSKTGARVPVTASLSALAQVNVDWEDPPAPGRRSTDSTFLVGLNYSF
jgi:putative salt-induced outer membrane protein YdiY